MLRNMPDGHYEGKRLDAGSAPKYAHPVIATAIPCGHTLRMDNMSRIRDARGLTQRQLAEKVGANQATISKIERGEGNPTLDMIRRIARALDCEPFDLFAMPELRRRAIDAIEAIDDPDARESALVVIEKMGRR